MDVSRGVRCSARVHEEERRLGNSYSIVPLCVLRPAEQSIVDYRPLSCPLLRQTNTLIVSVADLRML
jgi:hypothetical protein